MVNQKNDVIFNLRESYPRNPLNCWGRTSFMKVPKALESSSSSSIVSLSPHCFWYHHLHFHLLAIRFAHVLLVVPSKQQKMCPLSSNELNQFFLSLSQIHNALQNHAILSIVSGYPSSYIPKCLSPDLLPPTSDLFQGYSGDYALQLLQITSGCTEHRSCADEKSGENS